MISCSDAVGVVSQGKGYTIIKKIGRAGEAIEKHNHPEGYVTFTIVKGKADVTIDDQVYVVCPGKIIEFDGNHTISARFVEDSEVFVTLILKEK